MSQQNEHPVHEMPELTSQEMMQIHGGAQVDYFLKIETIDAESTGSAGLWGQGKSVRIDFCK